MNLQRYVTAEILSDDLAKNHGIDLPAGRLVELARQGFLPSFECDGRGPYFSRNDAKSWIREHLMVEKEARPYPTHLAAYNAGTWKGVGVSVPPELALAAEHLWEIPVAPFRWPCGVYFLVRAGRVVYVGQSIVPMNRLFQHLADKEFDRIFFLPVPSEHLSAIEGAFIRTLRPEYNGIRDDCLKPQEYHVDLPSWFEDHEGEIGRIGAYWDRLWEDKEARRLERERRRIPRTN